MLDSADVFIINPYPQIQVCQLPSIQININHFADLVKKYSVNCQFAGMVFKEKLEDMFMRYGFHKLIVLKLKSNIDSDPSRIWTTYCYLDLDMTGLLELANQSRRIQEMKAFW